jgi:hypothetical protein
MAVGQQPIDYSRRHLRFGWWSVLAFGTFGLVLESLHGFKIGAYLDVSNETRRLTWTLAHAHGTLLGLVHVLFGLTLATFPELSARNVRFISRSLVAASVLLPGGFFLGGIVFYSGDPGLGVLLVPFGAVLLLAAVFYLARESALIERSPEKPPTRGPKPRGAAV